jgi:hypothetical protein
MRAASFSKLAVLCSCREVSDASPEAEEEPAQPVRAMITVNAKMDPVLMMFLIDVSDVKGTIFCLLLKRC